MGINPEMFGGNIRFHKVSVSESTIAEAFNALMAEASPFLRARGASNPIPVGVGKNIREQIKEQLLSHNMAENKLAALERERHAMSLVGTDDRLDNPFIQLAAKVLDENVTVFINEANIKHLDQMNEAYEEVLATNAVLPAKRRKVHSLPIYLQARSTR